MTKRPTSVYRRRSLRMLLGKWFLPDLSCICRSRAMYFLFAEQAVLRRLAYSNSRPERLKESEGREQSLKLPISILILSFMNPKTSQMVPSTHVGRLYQLQSWSEHIRCDETGNIIFDSRQDRTRPSVHSVV